MKLTTKEKFILIREHGNIISRFGFDPLDDNSSNVIDGAKRIIELVESIQKDDLPGPTS